MGFIRISKGKGKSLVLLSSFGKLSNLWFGALPGLLETYNNLYLVDLFGNGLSDSIQFKIQTEKPTDQKLSASQFNAKSLVDIFVGSLHQLISNVFPS